MDINAREIALKILYKTYNDEAYLNIVFDSEISKYSLDNRDKSFIKQIVFGTLTHQITLDYIIEKYSRIKMKKISAWILNILRMGVYQIIYLDKIPKSAIVNESVKLAKKYGHNASSGFVNAILKNIDKDELDNFKFENVVEEISIVTSHPIWLINMLIKEYGIEKTYEICKTNNIEPPIYIRVNTLKTNGDDLIKKLENLKIVAKKTQIENVLIPSGLNNISNNKLFKEGLFSIQDIAASLVSNILSPKENENILDMCSSPRRKDNTYC